MDNQKTIKASRIQIKGLVQGVGFRPYIYRQAIDTGITGWVENRNDGVLIHAEGNDADIKVFIQSIPHNAPLASDIVSVNINDAATVGYKNFKILKSESTSEEITDICPDIAVCDDCLSDMHRQTHRIDYPLVNCTNCGPRFTIIRDLPYDREKTTMDKFIMCQVCKKEYTDILDRRFHAQPVACNHCGPEYELLTPEKSIKGINNIIAQCAKSIDNGKIIAIKGQGGFHLACNALDQNAVQKLREKKNRDGKPFAVMFRGLSVLKEYTEVNKIEEKLLTSWRKPIVLLKTKKTVAHDVSVGFNTIGAMLPYMPIHYLLFKKLDTPVIVLTSGNISEEPIMISNREAVQHLNQVTDTFLMYNRDIYNRTDDSVCMVVGDKERIIRRSRAFVPNPVNLDLDVNGILASGAELVNCFCIGKQNQAILSQHIGDLKNLETLEFYSESIQRFTKIFRAKPEIIARDLHPDYLSSKWAEEQKLPVEIIQHHHAHIASCMGEYGLDEKVIGIAMDGVGLGDDGKIWGGEFFICDLNTYSREYHFEYIPQPGGDAATKHPWRMAVSYLMHYFGKDFLELQLPFLESINKTGINTVIAAIEHKINSPLTSSAGRLFDAVSAISGICPESSFHAEAPMRLEAEADPQVQEAYSFKLQDINIYFKTTFEEIVKDILSGVPPSEISSKFHNTVINSIFAVAADLRKKQGINKIVLSGGTFQNRILLEQSEQLLKEAGFDVYTHSKIPSNDGGIALGQLIITAKRRALKCV